MGKMNPETFTGGYPQDKFILGPWGIHLYPEFNGIMREAEAAGMSEELTRQLETITLPKMYAFIYAKAEELGINLNGTNFEALPVEDQEEFYMIYFRALDDFGGELAYDTMGVPVMRGFNKTINRNKTEKAGVWLPDTHGLIASPYEYTHRTSWGKCGEALITFRFNGPVNETTTTAALWRELGEITPETVDVLEILLAHYMSTEKVMDPITGQWIAQITPKEIADYRGRWGRGGKVSELHERLRQEVLRLARIKLTMRWEDKRSGEFTVFGDGEPVSLLHHASWKHGKGRKIWTRFDYAPGYPLTYFYNWKGRGHKALLRLDPYRYGLAKKIGRYLALVGVPQAKHGVPAGAKIGTILTFAGEEPERKEPNKMIKQTAKAFNKLFEIGYLWKAPDLKAIYKEKCNGDYQAWLGQTVWSKLSPNIAQIIKQPKKEADA